MVNIVKDTKREILIILITVILIAFLISILANVAFTKLYANNPMWTTLSFGLLFALAIISLYLTIVSKAKRYAGTISFPITFSRKLGKFLDLPDCPMSVHARVGFDKLPIEGQKHLTVYDNWQQFWSSDLQRFIDQVIQETLLTTIFKQFKFEERTYDSIQYTSLPEGITENNVLRNWLENYEKKFELFLPYAHSVKTYGRNNCFLLFKSKYGMLRCEWNISYCNTPIFSEFFIKDADLKPLEDYHDYLIDLDFGYECNSWKILSKNLENFLEWVSDIERSLNANDWKKSEINRLYVVMQEIQRTLNHSNNALNKTSS